MDLYLKGKTALVTGSTSGIGKAFRPEEIAHLVTFLSSPLSSAINGSALRIDGGLVRSVF